MSVLRYSKNVFTLNTKEVVLILLSSLILSIGVSILSFSISVSVFLIPILFYVFFLFSLLYVVFFRRKKRENDSIWITPESILNSVLTMVIFLFLLIFFYQFSKEFAFIFLYTGTIFSIVVFVLSSLKTQVEKEQRKIIEKLLYSKKESRFQSLLKGLMFTLFTTTINILFLYSIMKILQKIFIVSKNGVNQMVITDAIIYFVISVYIAKNLLNFFFESTIEEDKKLKEEIESTFLVMNYLSKNANSTNPLKPSVALLSFIYANKNKYQLFSHLYSILTSYGLKNVETLEKLKKIMDKRVYGLWEQLLFNIDIEFSNYKKFINNFTKRPRIINFKLLFIQVLLIVYRFVITT